MLTKKLSNLFSKLTTIENAVTPIQNNCLLLAGGFGINGVPQSIINELKTQNKTGLTIVSNNAGVDSYGVGILIKSKQVRKMISSYIGENKEFER
jgi:acyl CoA:acetate/3-ketoacid CoA transferase alpha subunit